MTMVNAIRIGTIVSVTGKVDSSLAGLRGTVTALYPNHADVLFNEGSAINAPLCDVVFIGNPMPTLLEAAMAFVKSIDDMEAGYALDTKAHGLAVCLNTHKGDQLRTAIAAEMNR